MPNSRFYSSIAAATNLQVTANPGDTSIQVASSSGWPGSFPFIISLDYGAANEELVLATSGGPNVFTVTRSYDGTSASTHNAGAVVRHVSSAVDFTDSRTHEASNTGVHGITGAFVDTASVQTLTNKTLNAAILNSATLTGTLTATGATITNGTFTGATLTSPTVSGSTHSGTNTFTGTVALSGATLTGAYISTGGPTFNTLSTSFTRAGATDPAIRVRLDADTQSRVIVQADGTHVFGSGGATGDVTLSRTAAATLGVTGNFSVTGATSTTGNVTSTGDVTWTGIPWTTYSVAWTASTSNPSAGIDGTVSGRYKQMGKTVVATVIIIPGPTGFARGTGNYSISLPVAAANHDLVYIGDFHILSTGNGRWMGQTVISPGATTTSAFIPEVSGGSATGQAVFWQHDTPFPVNPGDRFRFTFTYEAA